MTTVAELIAILRTMPADLPVHVFTREEEFDDLTVADREAEPIFDHPRRCLLEGA